MKLAVREILRTTAEGELKAQGCEPDGNDSKGHWWKGPWNGPRFYLQFVGPDGLYVDEQQLRHILEDIAKYRPIRELGQRTAH